MNLTTEILLFIATICGFIYWWSKYQYSYWKRKNIPYIPPIPILGNLKDLLFFKRSAADKFKDFYDDEVAKDQPIVGIYLFHKPTLLIRETELIKRILIKDFNKFYNRYSKADPHSDAIGAYNLFFLRNPQWRKMRAKLTPVFTSGKMKQMFNLMANIGNQMNDYLCSLPIDEKKNSICMELKDLCALYTTDVIASIAYGVEANSLKNPNGEFRQNGKQIFTFTPYRAIEFSTIFFLPQLVSFFKFKVFSKKSTHFIRSTVEYVMNERERLGTCRNDIIDVLLNLRNESKLKSNEDEICFDGDILIAQAAVFFTAGFETSSATMSFGLYELSKNSECQDKLRNEIKDVLIANNGEITYDSIQNMRYLNMVIQEVLRLYPPLPFLDRECNLAKGESDYSLEPYSDFKVPNGTPIFIPIYGIHRDPKYFPEPNNFIPERFDPDNKDNIQPFTYMPFGVGPRNCIGERFGVLQAKIGLINFLRNHYVRLTENSAKDLKLENKALIIQAEGGIYCEIVRDPLIK